MKKTEGFSFYNMKIVNRKPRFTYHYNNSGENFIAMTREVYRRFCGHDTLLIALDLTIKEDCDLYDHAHGMRRAGLVLIRTSKEGYGYVSLTDKGKEALKKQNKLKPCALRKGHGLMAC